MTKTNASNIIFALIYKTSDVWYWDFTRNSINPKIFKNHTHSLGKSKGWVRLEKDFYNKIAYKKAHEYEE